MSLVARALSILLAATTLAGVLAPTTARAEVVCDEVTRICTIEDGGGGSGGRDRRAGNDGEWGEDGNTCGNNRRQPAAAPRCAPFLGGRHAPYDGEREASVHVQNARCRTNLR